MACAQIQGSVGTSWPLRRPGTNSMKIAVIPGDGIGNEVVPEGIRVLEAVGSRFGLGYTWDTSIGPASASPRRAP